MSQAVILAAGRGSRMLHWTESQPKCLVPLAGKALLDWQLEALQAAGVKKIFLVTGYLAVMLANRGLSCFFNDQWEVSNMVYSLFCAAEVLSQEETIISYSDIVYSPLIINKLIEIKADIAIGYDLLWRDLWEERFVDPLTDVESFRLEGDRIIEVGKKPHSLEEIEGQYIGLLKVTPQGWTSILSFKDQIDKKMDMTTFLQILIESNIEVKGIPILGQWCEVDSPFDLEYYESKPNLIQRLRSCLL